MALIVKRAKGKTAARSRRHFRVRKVVTGTPVRPRLVVTRSTRNITAQIIDDLKGHTLASASTLDSSIRGGEGDKSAPAGITFAVENQTRFAVQGIDKQLVGEVAANIRKIRPPEPYKGKGVKYQGEVIRRKAGKAGKK